MMLLVKMSAQSIPVIKGHHQTTSDRYLVQRAHHVGVFDHGYAWMTTVVLCLMHYYVST